MEIDNQEQEHRQEPVPSENELSFVQEEPAPSENALSSAQDEPTARGEEMPPLPAAQTQQQEAIPPPFAPMPPQAAVPPPPQYAQIPPQYETPPFQSAPPPPPQYNNYAPPPPQYGQMPQGNNLEMETRQWGLFLHLSHFAGWFIPVLGLLAPILIWQLKKNELPGLDEHGKNAANWILSELIYGAVSFVLVFVVIGIPLMGALGLMSIIFPIIAGIKANNGEVWKYPLAIPFFK